MEDLLPLDLLLNQCVLCLDAPFKRDGVPLLVLWLEQVEHRLGSERCLWRCGRDLELVCHLQCALAPHPRLQLSPECCLVASDPGVRLQNLERARARRALLEPAFVLLDHRPGIVVVDRLEILCLHAVPGDVFVLVGPLGDRAHQILHEYRIVIRLLRHELFVWALQQAVESNVAELEEATFGRGKWFDVSDNMGDTERQDVMFLRNKLTEDFENSMVRKSVAECLINAAVFGTGIGEIVIEEVKEMMASHHGDGHGNDTHGDTTNSHETTEDNTHGNTHGVTTTHENNSHSGDAHYEHVLHQLQNKPWSALYIACFFFFMIALGTLAFYAIQYAAQAGWSPVLFRVMEAITAYLPVGSIILFVLLLLSAFHINHIFHWMDPELINPESAHYDEIIAGKSSFLNIPFFLIRAII